MARAQKRSPTLAMKQSAAQDSERAQLAAKRDAFLHAAGPVLQREGINRATMAAVADRDGVEYCVVGTRWRRKMCAKVVVGMVNWTSRWFVRGGAMGADHIADGMAETGLRGILVKPVRKR